MPKPTMTDVARAAGVSQSTVSLVLNNRGRSMRISAQTEARVRAAMEELGFRPNLAARNLRLQRTRTIGLVTDFIASTPFAGRVVLGAQDEAWKDGHLLLLVNTDGNKQVEDVAVRALVDRQVDGLVYAAMDWRPVDLPASFTEVPSVLANCWDGAAAAPYGSTRIRPGEQDRLERGHPSVGPSEFYGGRLAAQAVVAAGHREIAFLGGPQHHPATVERESGFRQVLREARIPVRRGWVCYDEHGIEAGYVGGHIEGGFANAAKLLDSGARPTAFLCWNDRVAVGAITAAMQRGLRVPEDLSVVGYDDDPELAAHFPPGLTTVLLPHYRMGQAAVAALLTAIRTGEPPSPARQVAGELIVRASVAPPPADDETVTNS